MTITTRLLQLFLLLNLVFGLKASACTLFSATGDRVVGGGTLVAKNRDFQQDSWTYLEPVVPREGYRYLSLSAFENGEPKRCKGGINEKGLVVVSASTSSLPKELRKGAGGLSGRLLRKAASVEEAIALKSEMEGLRPNFYLLADAQRTALIEIAPGGKVSIKQTKNGTQAHSNHYLAEPYRFFNLKSYPGSYIRLDRVRQLLEQTPALDEHAFEQFSQDRAAGPDDSLFRVGNNKTPRTLATWIARLPLSGAPRLQLKLYNQNESEKRVDLLLDKQFWQRLADFTPFPSAPHKGP